MEERRVYYKGFDKDMKCRGFQFEEGKTYETDEAKLCEKGFHACECPLDVFYYYSPCDREGNIQKFHKVTLEDVSPEREDDSKVCAKKITIGAELNFFGLAKAHIEWVKNQIKTDSGAAVESGDYSAATNTGDFSAATNTGFRSAASNTGDYSAATNTGFRSAASNTGDFSTATNTGKNAIAVAWGRDSKASAGLGSYIVLAEYDDGGNFVAAKMGRVDGKRLKPNVFYKLVGGKFVKADKEEAK